MSMIDPDIQRAQAASIVRLQHERNVREAQARAAWSADKRFKQAAGLDVAIERAQRETAAEASLRPSSPTRSEIDAEAARIAIVGGLGITLCLWLADRLRR